MLTDLAVGEVAIPLDIDADNFVTLSQTDQVLDFFVVGINGLCVEIHLNVKISAILKIVAEVADAAHQQVPIDSAFIEHGDVHLQLALGYFRPGRFDFYLWSAVGLDRGTYAVLIGQVVGVVE